MHDVLNSSNHPSTHRRMINAIIHYELSTTNTHELNSDKRVGKINHSFRILNRNYSYFFNLIWLILYSRNIYHIHLKNPSPSPLPSKTLSFVPNRTPLTAFCCSSHFLENIKTYIICLSHEEETERDKEVCHVISNLNICFYFICNKF